MSVTKQQFNTIDVFNPYLGSGIEVPKIFWKPGTAASYNQHVGKTSVTGLWQGVLMAGMNPDSPFSYLGSPGNVNLHWPSITTYMGDHTVIGRSSVLGIEFRTAVAANTITSPGPTTITGSFVTIAAKAATITGAKVFGAGASMTWTSPAGLLAGFWTFNGIPLALLHAHSDRILKYNIEPIQTPLSKILKLQGVSFKWRKDTAPSLAKQFSGDNIGLIAQDVEEIVPEVVVDTKMKDDKDETKDVKGVKYESLVALLIEGMKEQQQQIEQLKQRVSDLE